MWAIADRCLTSSIHCCTFLLTNPLVKASVPKAAPRCCLPSVVIEMLVFSKTFFASARWCSLTISVVFEEFTKYPKSGPRPCRLSHHCRIGFSCPAAVASSAYHTCFTPQLTFCMSGMIPMAYIDMANGSP